MSPIEPIDYVLDELSESERQEAEALMATDPAFRTEVERLKPTVTKLERLPAEAWEDAAPPARPKLPTPGHASQSPLRRRVRPAMVGVAACALLAVGVALGLLLGGSDSGEDDPVEGTSVELELLGGAEAGRGSVTAGNDEVSIRVEDLPASEPGEFYEAWLLDGTRDVVSLGGFRVGADGSADIDLPLPEDPDSYRFYDISIEADDGDPAHSGQSVLRADT